MMVANTELLAPFGLDLAKGWLSVCQAEPHVQSR